jgi:uncharacterized protein
MRARTSAAAAVIGTVFGLSLSWSGMTNPDVLRDGLLFRSSYLYLFFASALLTAAVGLRLLARTDRRAVLTGEPLTSTRERPERRHVTGAATFGVGWALAAACPGPVATQLGQGIAWGIPTAAGIGLGVWLQLRSREPSGGRSRRAIRLHRPAAPSPRPHPAVDDV